MAFIIGATLAFFLEFILMSKKNKSLADRILTIWMLVFGVHLLLHFAEDQQLDQSYHFLLGVGTPFPLLHGPFLYLYTKVLARGQNRLNLFDYLHFIPAAMVVLYMLPFFFSPGIEKLEYTQALDEERSVFTTIVLIGIMISGIIYIGFSLNALNKFRNSLTDNFSNTERINLAWLKNLIIGMIGIWSIVVVGHILDSMIETKIGTVVDNLIYLGVTVFILMIGLFGIKQTNIFSSGTISDSNLLTDDSNSEDVEVVRYRKSGLKKEQADELQQRLENIMKVEKPYLDHKITLKSLAEKLNIHPNYLSQVINERFQKNFYDFINTARVDEFKKIVRQPQSHNLTLLAISIDCGFSSKSSFNKFFKKSTGVTPSDFIRSIKD